MDMIGKIRRLHSRDKKSKREISRTTGIARNTVAKWLDAPSPSTCPKYRRAEQPNKLTVFQEAIKLALKADAHRPKHERRTARALFAEVKAAGYEGGYSRLTDFIREWRQGVGQAALVNAFVPLSFELGEAFQFDWSEVSVNCVAFFPSRPSLPTMPSSQSMRCRDGNEASSKDKQAAAHGRGVARCLA